MAQDREAVRCPNRACPSARTPGQPGRVLFERAPGVVYKQANGAELVVLGTVLSASCPSCGHHWVNPDLGDLLERTITAAAARIAERKTA